MDSFQIRQKFFNFFKEKNHTEIPSSSLIPAQDPTLLFANAGMNQFKDVFLGKETRSYKRAVTIQKCMRAGGKHNDLDNVGFTKRHLTFFEMLGNFSFGDYFKKEAIQFAWEFLTEYLKFDPKFLYASVYYKDDTSFDIWHKTVGLPKERIVKLGAADNFWQMGDIGPCGPCSEIYIDRGEKFGCGSADCLPGCSCDRFLEIWNLVFMEYDRQPNGEFVPLKQTGVDTGMGLERLCSIMQDTDSVFETDLFSPLIQKIEELTKIKYKTASPEQKAAFKVLCDHTRAIAFTIADGAIPSNEGRGYVLRKIIRRAALFAQKLGDQYLLSKLIPTLSKFMAPIYPELENSKARIVSIVNSEIERFTVNLEQGQLILGKYFDENKASKTITGQQAFKLYDTYGFPLELTKIIAHEKGFSIDIADFEKEMEQQRVQSGKKEKNREECQLDENIYTHFTGYGEHVTNSKIIALIVDNKQVDSVPANATCYVITEASPFYVECGGQISDEGFIEIDGKKAKLEGLKKINKAIGAYIEAPVNLKVGQPVKLVVDSPKRINTMKNHTATHLLQAALMAILGKHVKQSGSLVHPDYLRFDFTYHENLSSDQIIEIENLINKKILENIPVRVEETTLKKAQELGVIAHFGEKYNPESVRVIDINGFSQELCGGTHVNATGDIGSFKITEVSSLSAGNKRIVALTGPESIRFYQDLFNSQKEISKLFNVSILDAAKAVEKQAEQLKQVQLELRSISKQILESKLTEWVNKKEIIKDLPFYYLEISPEYSPEFKNIIHSLEKQNPGFYFLISKSGQISGQAASQSSGQNSSGTFVASISNNLKSKIDFKQLSNWLKENNFKGGGKDNIIQGQVVNLPKDFKIKLKDYLEKNLK